MASPAKWIAPLLLIVVFVTSSSAANVTCPSGALNETVICANKTSNNVSNVDPCTSSFQQYACSNASFVANLSDGILVNLFNCPTNFTEQYLDPKYLFVFFSKLDTNKTNALFGNLTSQFFSSLNQSNSSPPPQGIFSGLQPLQIISSLVTCQQQQNVICEIFQGLVSSLDIASPKMTNEIRQQLYLSLQSILSNQKNASGSACSQNVSSSTWIKQNFGSFSKYANMSDFTALNANFSALDALSLLTLQQIASFSVDFDFSNNSAAINNILTAVSNANSVLDFLSALNVAAMSRNMTLLQPLLAQVLLNKTFEVLKANISGFNSSDYSQLFQDKLSTILPQITPDQLNLIPQNITCDSYQAIIKGMDMKFQQMNLTTQQTIFSSFVKPFLDKQGPACSQNLNSSALINQNLRSFSQFLDYSYFLQLNRNFAALDVLPLLTIPQRVNFTLGANFSADQATSLAGSLQNATDVYNFLGQLNAAVSMKGQSMVQPPLSQALLNRTFDVLKSNFSDWNTSDWSQLFQDKLSFVLPAITPYQLSLIAQNISCDSYQAIVAGLDAKFPQMTPGTQNDVFKNMIGPYMKNRGSVCPKNGTSSALLKQNFGRFSVYANFSDIVSSLGSSFNALDVLPSLSIQQLVDFTLNTTMNTTTANSIVNTLQTSTDIYSFLSSFNAGLLSKGQSMVQPPLSQALLNRTFDVLKSNFSDWNTSDWSQLFQDKLSFVLPAITPYQLSLIAQNISCDSYQAIVAGLDAKFPQMTPGTQNDVFKNMIGPYMKNKGSVCPKNGTSSALLKQNFGRFSVYANFSDIVSSLGSNFNALDVLPSLSTQQLVDFTLNTTMNTPTANSIVNTLQTSTDIYSFLSTFKAGLLSKNQTSVDPALSKALLSKTFQVLKSNFSSFKTSDWSNLFQDKLSTVLSDISPAELNLLPKNMPCADYQAVFKGLDSSFPKMSTGTRPSVYSTFIKPYLTTKDTTNAIVCYNQSDVNASSWFVTNMGSFFSNTNEGDLIQFANDSMLQTFARDPSCITMASKLTFSDSTATYYTSLLTSSVNFTLSSLPGVFLCFLSPSALNNLNANDSLSLTNKINMQCFSTSSGQAVSNPTPEQLQVSRTLVSKLTNFSSDAIINLGQSAVGLSPGQINNMTDQDLNSSVSSLASVKGWNTAQTRAIVSKLLNSNYTIGNLADLGSLVSGLPSQKLLTLDPIKVLDAAQNAQFASQLSSAPPTLQNAVVKKIISVNESLFSIMKNVPGNMVSFIPSSKLFSKTYKLTLQDVNSKSWTPSQASMFFDDVLSSTSDYSTISASVLQGFTCSTPSKIDNNQLKNLTKAMRTQSCSLSEAQLTCLSRQVTKNGFPADLDQYPTEVFMFLNASSYINGSVTCQNFYAKVGAANVSILQKGSKLRNTLLSQALTCLNVTGFYLTDANIQVLGQLSCDLNSSFIEASSGSGSLLSSFSQCKSFTDAQQASILKVLNSGSSVYGAPSTWTSDTLKSLGGITAYLNQTFISAIPTKHFNVWMKSAVRSSAFSRDQFSTFVKYRASPSSSRAAAGCPSGKEITAGMVNDPLLPLNYDTTNLDLCLTNDILLNYLSSLTSLPFTSDQLGVLKTRLDTLYPGGYPENVLSSLGAISFLCTAADIAKWNITSVDTLGNLLSSGPSQNLTQAIIAQFISSNNSLTGGAINTIGSKYICSLSSAQLNLITASALSDAQPLDVSACNQTVKDTLYTTAKAAYQDMTNATSAYFNLIKPYLGGATSADLKALAANSPNMDISTFAALNPNSVVSLTVTDVKSLLGDNTADLRSQESSPTVSQWIKNQKQSDLDTLGLDITGGIREISVSTAATTTIKTTSSSPVFLQSLSFVLTAVGVIFLF